MKRTTTQLTLIILLTVGHPGLGFIAQKISYWVDNDWVEGYASGFPENRLATDEVADQTTVGGVLINNPEEYRWELTFKHELSGSLDLKAEYDIGPDTLVRLNFRTFPEGDLEELNSIKFGGRTESYTYDDVNNTAEWIGRPVLVTPSYSNPDVPADTHRLRVNISYLGNSDSHPGGLINWGGTLMETNVSLDDVDLAMDVSSAYLEGAAICINATENTEAEFSILTTKLTKYQFLENVPDARLGGYINGVLPAEGFNFGVQAVDEGISLTQKAEANPGDHDVYRFDLSYNYPNAGPHDLQVGAFKSAIYGGMEDTGGALYKEGFGRYWIDPQQYGNWFYHEGMQWAYDPGQPNLDSMILYLLGGGWLQSTLELWPWSYLYFLQQWAYFDSPRSTFWVDQGNGDFKELINTGAGWGF